jgi:hypothetical protein
MDMIIIAIIIVVIIVLIWCFSPVTLSNVFDLHHYAVSAGFANAPEASDRMGRMNINLIKLLRHMRAKYAEGGGERSKITETMLYNYNPENISETDPRYTDDTSYTVGKGAQTKICLRDKKSPLKFVDFNTLMFVGIHELSHMGAYDVVGHPARFWEIFKFVLGEAVEAKIYAPIDYAKTPIDYCGLHIDYNPLFDRALKSV